MSWLSKIGHAVSKVVTFGRIIEPVAEAAAATVAATTGSKAANTVTVDLSLLRGLAGTLAGQLESVKGTGANNAEIATAMVPLVTSAIENSGFLDGAQVADVAKWHSAINVFTQSFLNLEEQLTALTTTTQTTSTTVVTANTVAGHGASA